MEPGPSPSSLRQSTAANHLQLHTGQETPGEPVGVVAELRYIDSAGFLGVDDGGALIAVGSMAGLEVQLGLVVAPSAVRQSNYCLLVVFEALAP